MRAGCVEEDADEEHAVVGCAPRQRRRRLQPRQQAGVLPHVGGEHGGGEGAPEVAPLVGRQPRQQARRVDGVEPHRRVVLLLRRRGSQKTKRRVRQVNFRFYWLFGENLIERTSGLKLLYRRASSLSVATSKPLVVPRWPV